MSVTLNNWQVFLEEPDWVVINQNYMIMYISFDLKIR